MNTQDKKRLTWILIAIAMFFANLMLVAIVVINNLAKDEKDAGAHQAATAAATSQAFTQPR